MLDHFPLWKGQCFVLTGVELILVMDLPFLHVMLLPKPPSLDLQDALSTIMVVLLTKELTSQPEKCDSGPRSWNPLVLPCFPPS